MHETFELKMRRMFTDISDIYALVGWQIKGWANSMHLKIIHSLFLYFIFDQSNNKSIKNFSYLLV